LIPELVGRLPIVTTLSQLTEEEMIKVLTSVKNSIIIQNKELLNLDEIEVEFGEQYYKTVVEMAKIEQLGARSLKSIVEHSLFYIMYHAPDLREKGIKKVFFDNYPSKSEDSKPLVYKDSGEPERLTQYRFFKSI